MWWTSPCRRITPRFSSDQTRVPASTMLGEEGRGLDVGADLRAREPHIRQGSKPRCGANYASTCRGLRHGPQSVRQGAGLKPGAIQVPLTSAHTRPRCTGGMVRKTAWHLRSPAQPEVRRVGGDVNLPRNSLVCDAPTQPCRVHGGIGFPRHTPSSHIYRHHRRYRITEARRKSRSPRRRARCSFLGCRRRSTARMTVLARPGSLRIPAISAHPTTETFGVSEVCEVRDRRETWRETWVDGWGCATSREGVPWCRSLGARSAGNSHRH